MDEQNVFPEQNQEEVKPVQGEEAAPQMTAEAAPMAEEVQAEKVQTAADEAPMAEEVQAAEEVPAAEEEAPAEEAQPELTPQAAFAQSAAQFVEETASAQDAVIFPEDTAQTPPVPPVKTGKREKKPWNRKIWIAGCAALLVVALIVAAVLLAAGNSPINRVEKALERTISDVKDSQTLGLLRDAMTGGSIEAKLSGAFVNELLGSYEEADGDAGLKLYGDLKKNRAVLTMYAPVGAEAFSASLHASSDAVALELPQVFDKVYGVNLKNFKESLKTSILAPDSGSSYALDEDTYALLEGEKDEAQSKEAEAANEHAVEAAKKLYKVLLKNVKKHAEIIQTNETIAFMEQSVKTTRVRVRLDGESVSKILRDTLTWVRDDKALKKDLTEVFRFCAPALIDGYGLDATDSEELLEQFYDAVYEAIDACDEIEEEMGGEALKLDFYMTKSGRLVQMEIEELGAFKCVLTYGPDPAAPALIRVRYDDGWDTYDVSYSVETNDKREYAAKFTFTSGSVTLGSADLDWNKREGDLRIKLNDEMSEESILVKGSLRSDKKEAELHIRSITFEDEIIRPDVTVIVKAKDKMPEMPEFTDLLTIDEEELDDIFSALYQMAYGVMGYDYY